MRSTETRRMRCSCRSGPDEFAAIWAEGARLSTDEAIAYAARGRGERRRPAAGWASLTPSELELVRLVGQHLTNPEIAARLFVSRAMVQDTPDPRLRQTWYRLPLRAGCRGCEARDPAAADLPRLTLYNLESHPAHGGRRLQSNALRGRPNR